MEERNDILVMCDSYKGCLTSHEVNKAVADGFHYVSKIKGNKGNAIQVEMSDGGEGMLDAFLAAMGGERILINGHDALMREIDVEYGLVDNTAIVETAQAIGLTHIEPELRNPMRTTTYGVGEILIHAYHNGARHFIVGLGGSATSDCGIGMLEALGKYKKLLQTECSFILASDVTNPLYGPNGAAYVFAPQKGADVTMAEALDDKARCFAYNCARWFGYDRSRQPGAGAAGGLGYAFMQFFNADQMAGADMLLDAICFDAMLHKAKLVVTGEGHSDRQTLMGKLPQRILQRAQKEKVPVWLVSGGVDDVCSMYTSGFSRVIAVTPPNMPINEAMKADVAKKNITNAIVGELT